MILGQNLASIKSIGGCFPTLDCSIAEEKRDQHPSNDLPGMEGAYLPHPLAVRVYCTFCAGVAAGEISGVAKGATIHAVKVLTETGTGGAPKGAPGGYANQGQRRANVFAMWVGLFDFSP